MGLISFAFFIMPNVMCTIARRMSYKMLWFVMVLFMAGHALASSPTKIAFVGNTQSETQQRLIEKTLKHLKSNNVDVAFKSLSIRTDTHLINNDGDYDLLIPIGSDATKKLLEKGINTPQLSIFTPSMPYNKMVIDDDTQHSAIFFNQPASRYLALIKNITSLSGTVSLIYSDYSESFYNQLFAAAQKQNVTVIEKKISNPDDIYKALDEILEQSDVLLALPDPTIYNRRSIKTIFLTSYQRGIPIIGFSESYTKAGAIGSIHSNLDDVALQLSEAIIYFTENSYTLPEKAYPRYFRISSNTKVARSLGITLDDNDEIHKQIVEMEQQ